MVDLAGKVELASTWQRESDEGDASDEPKVERDERIRMHDVNVRTVVPIPIDDDAYI